ncbi:MAG: hypothetical protein AB3N23_07895 [Paracoccaceae bacterium]
MNANQLINMVMRVFMRKMISRGIDKGFDMVARKSPSRQVGRQGPFDAAPRQQYHDDAEGQPKRKKTPEERERIREIRQARRAAKQARQAMKVTNRVTRM